MITNAEYEERIIEIAKAKGIYDDNMTKAEELVDKL